ncbi:hypothetical protein HS1genome_2267 [Sulfodiicoccus acidiphilus]|uniref:Phenylacetate--CoA ligase n=1 Tax=Sulfodiicoccus acidiphilus TaxID=1670455 RepID=A0A348B6S6_9CREN|nr:hypothetical protein HS1genome_2267 [Sulfodiicoccus acidiphilus]GGT96156.1 hypothetical protein GCM10007116_12100 [Sulfodiicoccus acidiphilus]
MDETDPQGLSVKEIEKVQLSRFRALVERVWNSSPFYRRRMKEARLSPDELRSPSDLHKLPFTTKEELRRDGYPYGGEFLAVPFEELVGWHMTSGTTGVPSVGAYTAKDVETWRDLVARCLRTAGVTNNDVIANVYGYGLFTGGIGLHMEGQRIGAKVIPWGAGRTEALIKAMVDFKATVITGTPSYELVIAERVRKEGLKTGPETSYPRG